MPLHHGEQVLRSKPIKCACQKEPTEVASAQHLENRGQTAAAPLSAQGAIVRPSTPRPNIMRRILLRRKKFVASINHNFKQVEGIHVAIAAFAHDFSCARCTVALRRNMAFV